MIDIAVIGTGQMAEIYASLLKERSDCKIWAVQGNTPAKTADFARRFDAAPYGPGDLARLYDDHPQITTTIITTPEWVRTEPLREMCRVLTAALDHFADA